MNSLLQRYWARKHCWNLGTIEENQYTSFQERGNTGKIWNKGFKLKGHVNLVAKCAVLSRCREIDMSEIIGKYEPCSVPRSFMNAEGKQNNGGDGKSELVNSIVDNIDGAKIEWTSTLQPASCVKVKKRFKHHNMCRTIVIVYPRSRWSLVTVWRIDFAFYTYQGMSLKHAIRLRRKEQTTPNDTVDIPAQYMKEILAHDKTKCAPRNQGCFRKFANSRVLETSLLWKAISCDLLTQMRLLNASWVGNWSNYQIKS